MPRGAHGEVGDEQEKLLDVLPFGREVGAVDLGSLADVFGQVVDCLISRKQVPVGEVEEM